MDPREEINEKEEGEMQFSSQKHYLLGSKTSHLDDVLSEKLEHAFHKETSQLLLHDVAKIAIEHDPIDLAYAITRLPANARIILYENLPDIEAKVSLIINTNRNTRSILFRQISDQEIKELIDQMPTDEAVNIMDDMSDRRLKRVLELLDPKKVLRIRELRKHDRNSAGRLMTDEFFAFSMNTTIGEVSAQIRDNPGIDLTRSIFVLTDSGELAGLIPPRNLIVNPAYLPLKQVMRPVLHTVKPDASRDEVVDIVERYALPTLPVIDDNNQLVGVIIYEDVVEAMEDIADSTIATIAGTGEDLRENEPIMKRFFCRAPWLVVTLFAGFVTSSTMSHFTERLWFTFMPIFVPLVAGMSGNVGLQCSTVLVRGMATGELSSRSIKEAIKREIGIGLLIGSAFGLLCGIVIYTLNQFGIQSVEIDPFALGTTVGIGLFVACMTATMLGTFSPFFFARLGVDPAIASGPMVAAFNDITATVTFLLVARLIYFFFV